MVEKSSAPMGVLNMEKLSFICLSLSGDAMRRQLSSSERGVG